MIKNQFQNKMLPSLDDFDNKSDYLKDYIDDYQFFKEFYEYNIIFKDISFEYSYDEINNFNGYADKYTSKFNNIRVKSNNNYQNVSEMLKFILFDFLSKLLNKKNEYEMNNKSISGERANIILSQFIYKVFEKIEFDNKKLFISKENSERYNEMLIYQNNCNNFPDVKFSISKESILKLMEIG